MSQIKEYIIINFKDCGCETVIVCGRYQSTECDKHYLANKGDK